jgi:hypothetical protein
MKIRVIQINESENDRTKFSHNVSLQPEVVMLKVSGNADSSNAVLQKARKLIEENGSDNMVESFDWAVQNSVFISKK